MTASELTLEQAGEIITTALQGAETMIRDMARRIYVLQEVIADNLQPEDCDEELHADVVRAILEERSVPDIH